jgi:transcriptional regulator with XRE-family HTH domain
MDGMESSSEVVAANFSRLRAERGISLSEIARQAGLAKGTLAQLELGTGNPTVGTLDAIAAVLDVHVSQLVSRRAATVFVQRGAESSWEERGPGLTGRALSHVYGAGMVESYEVRLTGARHDAEPHLPGTLEQFFVITGKVLVGPSECPMTLAAGDFIRFPADVPHLYQALGGRARAHLIMSTPQPTPAAGAVVQRASTSP